ncbi:MAG TPA: hypothetical protein VGE98_14010 [Thermoanaerobaculia bacterium]
MTTTIELQGRITDEGELELDLPAGLPAGDARVTIELTPEPDWDPAELEELLRIEPLTGKEIVEAGLTGAWKDEGITSGADWVEKHREQRRERHQW